tara:strand:+ start:764 stop:1252 length:489 start_codon:yes stop_codon:yes gene_type:complete
MNLKQSVATALVASGLFVAAICTGADEAAEICAARAQSNQAIAAKDIDALKATWLPSLHVAASSGVSVTSGTEMAAVFLKLFDDPAFDRFERLPVSVRLSPGKTLAAETGKWTGYWHRDDGTAKISGPYMAQWQRVNGAWKISAEVFVATECSGSSTCESLR